LSACAHYGAVPLGDGADVLSPPVLAVLSAEAAKIDRPYLRPTPIDLRAPLDLNAVSVIAVLENRDLRALRERARISEAQAFSARLLPDPIINVAYDKLLAGPDPLDNLVVQLVQDINLLRTRRVTAASSRALTEQVRLDLAWAEWQTAGAARVQAVRIVALEQQVVLAKLTRDSAEGLFQTTLRASLRGDITADQVQANRLAALDATDRFRQATLSLVSARGELARLLGVPPATPIRLAAAVPPPPVPDPARLLRIAQARRFDLGALRQGYAAQEAAVRLAILNQFPTLILGVTGTRDTGGNKLIGGAINMTLPLWNRGRGGIAVQQATRAALKAEYEARLFQTRAEIAAAAAGIAVAERTEAELRPQLVPLQRFADASARAAARGDIARAIAMTAAQTLRDRQTQLLAAEQAVAEQTIALELLTGVPAAQWTLG
jgi:cobalt-zinc-cadmium efflux system outer membrane protein